MAEDRYGGYGPTRDWGQAQDRMQRLDRPEFGRQDRTAYGSEWGEHRSFGEGDYGGDRPRPSPGGADQRYGQAYTPDAGRGGGGRDDRTWMERTGERMRAWMNDDDDRQRGGMFGQHRGKGPKGWKRSSERIREDVCERLADDPMLDASEIEVAVQDNEVTLSGTVTEREDKRRAERLVEQCSGVEHVQNNLRVQPRQQTYGQSSTTMGQGQPTAGGSGALGAGQNDALARVTEGKTS